MSVHQHNILYTDKTIRILIKMHWCIIIIVGGYYNLKVLANVHHLIDLSPVIILNLKYIFYQYTDLVNQNDNF